MKKWALIVLLPALALAQRHDGRSWAVEDSATIHRSFTLSGGGPHRLTVDNVTGYVHVTSAAGNQVEVSVARHNGADSADALARAKADEKMDITQEGDTVRLYADGPYRHRGDGGNRGYQVRFDCDIQVPADTAVDLKTINGGSIVVKGTTGDYEIRGLNGGIEMENVSGSGNVRTLNGPVKVTFAANPTKPSEFRSLNGAIDVYFRPGLNAALEFHTLNGGVYADFDVTVGSGKPIGRRITEGHVGQGGPLLKFNTLNGSIKLHSKPPTVASSFGGR